MTTATTSLPSPKAIRDLLSELLGRDVVVTPCPPLVPGVKSPSTLAVYVDTRLRTTALVVTDLPLSAYAGAAIGLIPKGGAEASIEDRELAPNLTENIGEVVNIMAGLFNIGDAPHLRLYGVHPPGDLPPSDVSALARSIGRRLDLSVQVAGYGKGQLAVILA